MRQAFAETLINLAKEDERIVLLTADMGFNVLEQFASHFPTRFYNVGIAEQNMLGIATGLAEAGFIPFVYSIATFVTLRPYEFIRNGALLHHLPVRIVGIGGGFEYGIAGHTHHALEDIAILRSQPNMRIIVPADDAQARNSIKQTWHLPGPIYYRLSKNERKNIVELDGKFLLNDINRIASGKDVLWICLGPVTNEVIAATNLLNEHQIASTIINLASLHPIPEDRLRAELANFPLVITVETHYINGGLGSAIAEIIAEAGLSCKLVRKGVTEVDYGKVGDEKYYTQLYGLNAEALAESVLSIL